MLPAVLAATKSSSDSYLILIYIVIFGALYFFYLRPRSRRQKAQRQTARKVEVGDRAQTIGGFVGTVVRNDSDLITLRTDAGVELEFIPSAIARRYDPIVSEPEIPESTDDDEHPTEGDSK
ncbi:MAG TPA: preprotein translocase subunit YajC [Acidimicrobiales bacterium]|jgi:preprotein translocase subunit YajC|nr:preprotein translocase subunit YajC [Acidimicrobiales bacterium]